jgi:hypothetical protein
MNGLNAEGTGSSSSLVGFLAQIAALSGALTVARASLCQAWNLWARRVHRSTLR